MNNSHQSKIAIIDPNTLAAIGLRQVLQNVMPIVKIDTYGSFAELEANNPDGYVHYFVSLHLVLENRNFFLDHRQKTIVLTTSTNEHAQLNDFHELCVNVPEEQLIKSLLVLQQHAHGHGKRLPITLPEQVNPLSDREKEVLSLIAQGYINKEIANILNIGITTVITHRKNIMEKLSMKSVSALTIYAVTHGLVDINRI
ncbi:MAG: helix-turn-helix transcriptional regulator [Prevotella sp.]|nr:helix-turn-helix transcriptional regulator [Prevotella sp.]